MSLIELLAVMALIAIMAVFTGPAIRAVSGAGTTNKAISDLSQSLEFARTYAMANRTFVRVALASVPAGGDRLLPTTVVLPIYSADGSLDADGATGMADAGIWPALDRPLVLEDFAVTDSLNAALPKTSQDAMPSESDITSFSRQLGGLGAVTFTEFVQFLPNGEARVIRDIPTRFIKLGYDRPKVPGGSGTGLGANAFILRISGVTGNIQVLRGEDL